MDLKPVIDQMNEFLEHAWTGVAQYLRAGFILEDMLSYEKEGVGEYTKMLRDTPATQLELKSSMRKGG